MRDAATFVFSIQDHVGIHRYAADASRIAFPVNQPGLVTRPVGSYRDILCPAIVIVGHLGHQLERLCGAFEYFGRADDGQLCNVHDTNANINVTLRLLEHSATQVQGSANVNVEVEALYHDVPRRELVEGIEKAITHGLAARQQEFVVARQVLHTQLDVGCLVPLSAVHLQRAVRP